MPRPNPPPPPKGTKCGAKTRAGHACKAYVTPGRERCHKHGGKQPRGIASANFRHGKYSRDLPTRLMAKYQEAVSDPELFSMRNQAEVVEALIHDKLSATNEFGDQVNNIAAIHAQLEIRAAQLHDAQLTMIVDSLAATLQAAQDEKRAWNDALSLIDMKRKISDSETKRQEALNNYLSTEQAFAILAIILDVILRVVPDRKIRDTIAIELERNVTQRLMR